jgi:hypothetical protein
MLCQTFVFASDGICRSCSAFYYVRGLKHQRSFFVLRCAQCYFHKKRAGKCYAEIVFFHLFGSACHVVHSGASGVRNVYALIFNLEWAWCDFHQKHIGTRYVELAFSYMVDLRVTWCIPMHSGREILTHYFSS